MSKAPKTGLTKKHWFGYMFGDWGGCMTFALMASIFSIYCTNVLGINATVMGVLTIIWTIWDAVNDPMMGALMDKAFAKKQTKNGKFRPWLLRATPPAGGDRHCAVDCTHLPGRHSPAGCLVLFQNPL